MTSKKSRTRRAFLRASVGAVVAGILPVLPLAKALAERTFTTKKGSFRVVTVTDGLEHPWSLAFLPDGALLVTERPGRLRIVKDGALDPQPVAGLPKIKASGQGGLMDVATHPGFADNRLIYISYAAKNGGTGTEVARGRLNGHQLDNVEVIFRALPKSGGGRHFGSRLLFAPDGYLYITLGDRGNRPNGQDLATHPGSIIRLKHDGGVPNDNPFAGAPGARPEIFTYGNRNVQGIALQPGTGTIWAHEHGPQGGDELNVITAATNYGWPVITYGRNYGIGTSIGEGTEKKGMAQPVHYWVPSIAPSGLAFYDGDKFPHWRGNLFVGSLKFSLLVRLELGGGRVVVEERMLEGALGRIRDVRSGPDGYLYLLTDASNGNVVRLEPL
ncbi:MAG: PQQ-dependent sugar dehydrogenase [Gammaproteobacteria bacterium]